MFYHHTWLMLLMLISCVYIDMSFVFFFFKQKTAYEMRISDWSSDVCSSDLHRPIEDKSKLVAAINRLVVEVLEVSADDIFIALIPVPNENFSFGRGALQLAEGAPRW